MTIDVTIPAMLAVSIQQRRVLIEAQTLSEAMRKLAAAPKAGAVGIR